MEKSVILAAIRARLVAARNRPADAYVRFSVGGQTAGWIARSRVARLARFRRVFRIDDASVRFSPALASVEDRSEAIAEVASELATAGELSAWRNERYAVRPHFDAAPLFYLERASARWFGIRTYAVHVNGFTVAGGERRIWLARRSAAKPIDPGRFDTLVGGGITERDSVADSLLREAWEEAGIEAALARTATASGQVGVEHQASDGLQRETIFVYDLGLPQAFAPANQDGEVSGHRLLDVDQAAELIAGSEGEDAATLDACVVTFDHLIRHDTWALTDDARAELATLCRRSPD
ncbi:MAG: DUF4743 domain-containing protein [Betaproteobacteria bacterium]